MNRTTFEAALDSGTLETRVRNYKGDNWYRVRRNGRTRTWKLDPTRFVIPIKFRLKDTMRVEEGHFNRGEVDQWFRVVPPEGITVLSLEDPRVMHDTLKKILGE